MLTHVDRKCVAQEGARLVIRMFSFSDSIAFSRRRAHVRVGVRAGADCVNDSYKRAQVLVASPPPAPVATKPGWGTFSA